MSDETIETIITMLEEKIAVNGAPDFPVKLAIRDHTPIIIDQTGVKQQEGDGEITVHVSAENLVGTLTGKINPAMAFIAGKIVVEGDNRKASALKSILI